MVEITPRILNVVEPLNDEFFRDDSSGYYTREDGGLVQHCPGRFHSSILLAEHKTELEQNIPRLNLGNFSLKSIVESENAEDAWNLFISQDFDLAVIRSDLSCSGRKGRHFLEKTGFELAERIRQLGSLMPILFLDWDSPSRLKGANDIRKGANVYAAYFRYTHMGIGYGHRHLLRFYSPAESDAKLR